MGWPRKNDGMRIYRDKCNNGYLIILIDDSRRGPFEAIANYSAGMAPSLCSTQVRVNYIAQNWLKRMQWDELPQEWQDAFLTYLNRGVEEGDPPVDPATIRGFWRIGCLPTRQCHIRH